MDKSLLIPPLQVRRAFKKGLELYELGKIEGFSGKGLEDATIREARAIAKGTAISLNKLDKGYRFFQRNARFAKFPEKSPAGVAWWLWGGRAGKDWFNRLSDQIQKDLRNKIRSDSTRACKGSWEGNYPGNCKRKKRITKIPTQPDTEWSKEWNHSFGNAPQDLADVIAVAVKPQKIETEEFTAFTQHNTGIAMGNSYRDSSNQNNKAVWRHEYGHWLDGQMGYTEQKRRSKIYTDALKKGEVILADWLEAQGSSNLMTEELRQKLKREFKIPDGISLIDDRALMAFIGGGVRREGYMLYISQKKTFRDALTKDSESLISRQEKYEAKLKKQFKASGLPKTSDLASMADQLQQYEMEKVNKKFEGDRKKILEFMREKAKANNPQLYSLFEQVDNPSLQILDTFAKAAFLPPGDMANFVDTVDSRLYRHKNHIANDLAGSLTLNKVGMGHSNDYYERNPSMQGAETYANLISIYGRGDSKSDEILRYIAPNTFRHMKDDLKKFSKEGYTNND